MHSFATSTPAPVIKKSKNRCLHTVNSENYCKKKSTLSASITRQNCAFDHDYTTTGGALVPGNGSDESTIFRAENVNASKKSEVWEEGRQGATAAKREGLSEAKTNKMTEKKSQKLSGCSVSTIKNTMPSAK